MSWGGTEDIGGRVGFVSLIDLWRMALSSSGSGSTNPGVGVFVRGGGLRLAPGMLCARPVDPAVFQWL